MLLISFSVFQYLNTLNKEIDEITFKSNRVSMLTDEIRISAVLILKDKESFFPKVQMKSVWIKL